MKTILWYSAFIRELQLLYARLVLSVIHIRTDRYHKQSYHAIKSCSQDINPFLLKCADKFLYKAGAEPKLSMIRRPPPSNATTRPLTSVEPSVTDLHVINKENIGELSTYFKARSNGAGLYPGIIEKLEHSTWEHIYATLRCARQGDSRNAKMHTNIASSACKELAHFMNEGQYQRFVAEIKAHLDALNAP
ncbi:MAG: hypothetical protein HY080_15240 [Gammaproteobacteria bacterium]|nr:hypothetical protein [Gammaproteobacteria bacterium]